MRKAWLGVIISVLLVACGQQQSTAPEMPSAAMNPAPVEAKMAHNAMLGGAEQSLTEISEPQPSSAQAEVSKHAVKKYIALSHHLSLEMPAEQMQANFDAAIRHCEALNCQILNATYNKKTPYSPPSASLNVRIPPRNVNVFLSGLEKNSEIMQHSRDAEDKTNQVVDTDARILNLTHLRDRLRGMLNDKRAGVKDIVEVERELANTQIQLDSMQSIRKVLALETDLVAVNMQFNATQGIAEQGFFAPIAQALKNAGQVLIQSIAAVITFIMGTIPWLFVGIPVLLLGRKLWLKMKS